MADKALSNQNAKLDDTIFNHRWGFADSKFKVLPDGAVTMTGHRYAISGTEMPELIEFAEKALKVKLDLRDIQPEVEQKPVTPPNLNEGFVAAVHAAFAETQYSTDDLERLIHSHGQTTVEEVYRVLYGKLDRVCDMVFYLEQEDDAVKIIQLAGEHNVCLVPYGGGSSVSCALKLPLTETRMIVMVNTRRLNKIEWIDHENHRACIQAGIVGKDLEEQLAEQGYTCGHEPDSLELSTLGGWIATNASGMKKNRYGNIEQVVESVSMVTPRGQLEQLQSMPRVSMGMQMQQLMFGSEGNLGLITKAIIRIHKLPEVTKYNSIVFRNWRTGVEFMHELMQSGTLPASIRLLDNIQFRFGSALKPRPTAKQKIMSEIQKRFLLNIKGFDPEELVAATVLMEGNSAEVNYQESHVTKLAKKHGGVIGGETNGKRGYMLTYAIAYIRDFLADYYLIGETYETTAPWNKVNEVCEAVAKRAVELHHQYNLPGIPYVSPRVTQLYHTGACIYFTHGFSTKGVDRPDLVFAKMEHELRQTIMDAGGSISHHHGIGKLRADFMDRTMSSNTMDVLREVKRNQDPQNIFGIRNNIFAE
ncbi:MAG: FAD-binding oxidoreductase [Candidatus Promineifilaceae bacterium]